MMVSLSPFPLPSLSLPLFSLLRPLWMVDGTDGDRIGGLIIRLGLGLGLGRNRCIWDLRSFWGSINIVGCTG